MLGRKLTAFAIGSLALVGTVAGASAQVAAPIGVPMIDRSGGSIGAVTVTVGPHGALLHADLIGLPPGPHIFSINAVGACSTRPQERPEDPLPFQTAGATLNPNNADHGFLNPTGPRVGDLPILYVTDAGTVVVDFFAPGVTTDMLTSATGSALVIRANGEDYTGGTSGARIGCGVIIPAG